MLSDDCCYLGLVDVGRRIRAREMSSVEVTRNLLERIARLDGRLGSYALVTPEEALAGITRNGARALGMGDTHGTIEAGKDADLAFWEVGSPGELAYAMGANPCVRVLRAGVDSARNQ